MSDPAGSPPERAIKESTEDAIKKSVYGETPPPETSISEQPTRKNIFEPWHHPIKQLVREYQWMDATRRLVNDGHAGGADKILRYFTLPGTDLFDVRMLADEVSKHGIKVEYFGFDSGAPGHSDTPASSEYLTTESALRQAGLITDNTEVLSDRLEDIAQVGSQAEDRLKQKHPFDIVNIDACDNLAYVPAGRAKSLFDALTRLMLHQLTAQRPWLLFLTTRADSDLLGPPGGMLQGAIHNNLALPGTGFAAALAECMATDQGVLTSRIAQAWTSEGMDFLKIFSIGIGKFLLQFFHGQPNLRATVKLESAFAYKVSTLHPDMISLAFRIYPGGLKALSPTAGAVSDPEKLEPLLGIEVVKKAAKMWNLDDGILEAEARKDAIDGSVGLLKRANFDLDEWRKWLANLPLRPMEIGADLT